MENKLLKRFGDDVCIINGSTRQGNIIFNKTWSISDAFHNENSTTKSQDVQLKHAALVLCQIILSIKSKTLPENLTTDFVLNGKTDVPPKLSQFFQYLICGPDSRRWKSDAKQRHIQSIGQYVIFPASSGCKLPIKHLKLGAALKSLTSRRKAVEILNRYGHCANYYAVEEIETELTFSATETQMETPIGMSACSKGGVGCAFDNFDQFVESQSGKDTLHDTVGISYDLVFPEINGCFDGEKNDKNTQEKTKNDSETSSTTPGSKPVKSKTRNFETDFSNEENSVSISDYGKTKPEVVEKSKNKKRRRTYDPWGITIAPYRKKSKLKDPNILSLDNPKQILTNLIEEQEAQAWMKYSMWMADINTDGANTAPCG